MAALIQAIPYVITGAVALVTGIFLAPNGKKNSSNQANSSQPN
jgi:hypothetical protein